MSVRQKSFCAAVVALTVAVTIPSVVVLRTFPVATLTASELRVDRPGGIDTFYASTSFCWPRSVGGIWDDDYVGTTVKFRLGEQYKKSPVISFQIGEDGAVSNVKLVRSSGVKDVDDGLVAAAARWKYRPRPNCGVLESTASVDIHFR